MKINYRRPTPLSLKIIFTVVGLTYLAIGVIGFSLWAMSIAVNRAKAHEAHTAQGSTWHYPYFCCHDNDCAPVEVYKFDPATGLIYIRTKHGAVLVSRESIQNKLYESGDNQTHACIVPDPQNPGGFFVRCVFLPKGM